MSRMNSTKFTKEEMKKLKADRKELRQQLKGQGIKKKVDFETFAKEVGLAYPQESAKGKLLGLWLKAATLGKVAAVSTTLYTVLGLGAAALAATFLVAYVSEVKGNFTVNLTADMIEQGFVLSDTEDFAVASTRLYTEEIENLNAISIQDISATVDTEQDGAHNGTGYMAYTFYLRNEGDEVVSYVFDMNITSSTNGILGATWVMLFQDGEQLFYSELSDDGDRENLYGYTSMPFSESSLDLDTLYYEEDGLYGIVPVDFVSDTVAVQGLREEMQPDEVHKYTIVVWIEGDDPQCTNDILGGHAGFTFQFEMVADDELDLFKGLYMTDYQDAQEGLTYDETEETETEENPADTNSPIQSQ